MKRIVYVLFLLVITIIVVELSLRFLGNKPGFFREYNQFELVDSLYEFKNYTTDEHGIYKFSSWVTDSVYKYLNYSEISQNTYFAEYIENEDISFAIDWGMDHLGEVFEDLPLFTKEQFVESAKALKIKKTNISPLLNTELSMYIISEPDETIKKNGFINKILDLIRI